MLCVGQNLITRGTGNFQYPALLFLDLGLWAPFVDPHIHFKPSLVQLFQCQETPDYSSYVADYLWSTFNLHSLKLSLYIRTNSLLWEEKKRWNSFVTTMSRLLVCWIESTEVMTISVVTGGVIRHASSSVGEEFAELFCCLICCFSEAERWYRDCLMRHPRFLKPIDWQKISLWVYNSSSSWTEFVPHWSQHYLEKGRFWQRQPPWMKKNQTGAM